MLRRNRIVVNAAALLVVAWPLRAQVGATQATPRPLVIVAGKEKWNVTASELASLPRQTVTITEDTGDSARLAGIPLWHVLRKVGIPSSEAAGRQRGGTYLKVVGSDRQLAVIALTEVDPSFSRRVVLLADERNGRPLDQTEGPWRIIIPDERRHARWIRGVVSIEVVSILP